MELETALRKKSSPIFGIKKMLNSNCSEEDFFKFAYHFLKIRPAELSVIISDGIEKRVFVGKEKDRLTKLLAGYYGWFKTKTSEKSISSVADKAEQKKEMMIKIANENKELITRLNESDLSVADFCIENGIDQSIIKTAVEALAYTNDPLYHEYFIKKKSSWYNSEIKKMLEKNCTDEEFFKFIYEVLDRNVAELTNIVYNGFGKNFFVGKEKDRLLQLLKDFKVWRREKIEEIIKEKNDDEAKERLEQKKEIMTEIAKESRQLVERINESKLSLSKFCKINDIDQEMVKKVLEALKFVNDPLYQEYLKIQKAINAQAFAILSEKIKIIANYILFGIDDNGVVRKFDIVDYYGYLKINLSDLNNIIKNINLTKQEYYAIIGFINQNKHFKPLDKSSVLNSTIVVGVKVDENGASIPGTGRKISGEERLEIIDWLQKNKIPLTESTYNCAFNRYVRGQLIENINPVGHQI